MPASPAALFQLKLLPQKTPANEHQRSPVSYNPQVSLRMVAVAPNAPIPSTAADFKSTLLKKGDPTTTVSFSASVNPPNLADFLKDCDVKTTLTDGSIICQKTLGVTFDWKGFVDSPAGVAIAVTVAVAITFKIAVSLFIRFRPKPKCQNCGSVMRYVREEGVRHFRCPKDCYRKGK